MINRTTRAPAARGPQPDATLDLDFVRMRGFVNGQGVSLENLLTETRSSTAMTPGPGGILRQTPASTPRFAKRWDGRGKGLLVELGGANALLHSGDLSSSSWTKSRRGWRESVAAPRTAARPNGWAAPSSPG